MIYYSHTTNKKHHAPQGETIMAGYADDYSMSNNAVAAYERGLRPRSKWNKRDILDALPADKRAALHLDSYPLAFLREHFLSWEEWHHTSKQYNQTDFYLPRIPEWIETTEDVDTLYQRWQHQRRTNAAKETTAPVKARISYTHWVDKRTCKTVTEYAIIVGPWAHTQSGLRKRTDGNHFHVDHTYTRAQFGTASIFHDIERSMKR